MADLEAKRDLQELTALGFEMNFEGPSTSS